MNTWQEQALHHAKTALPDESCGVVINVEGTEQYFPCKNIAIEGANSFTLDPEDWAKAEELVNEFYKNKKCPQKLSMTYFQDFNRIKNLGFKDEEVSKMYYNDPKNLIDCIKRKQEIKLKYMEKVI